MRVALAVTAGALLGVFAFSQIPLPWVDAEYARLVSGGPSSMFGLAALGIAPWLTGALLTEIAAAIVPRWRALRHGGFEGRARLARASVVVGVAAACVQAWTLVQQLAAMEGTGYDSVAPELYGLGPRLALMLTIVAGTCVVRLVAALLDRIGVFNGIVLLVAATFVPSLLSTIAHLGRGVAYGTFTPLAAVIAAACLAAPAVLAWRFVRPFSDADEPSDACRPSAGAVPAMWAIALLDAAWRFPVIEDLLQYSLMHAVAAFAITVPLVPLCARAFGAGAGAGAAQALRASWLVNLGIVAAAAVAQRLGGDSDLILVIILFAAVRDVVDEVRFRRLHPNAVSVWPMQSFAHAAPAVQALRNEGIAVHARSSHYRALTHFFGPWAPIDLLVDDIDAPRARSIVRSVAERSLAQT